MTNIPTRAQIDEEITKRGGLQSGTAKFVRNWLESMRNVPDADEAGDGNMVVAKLKYEELLPKYQLADQILNGNES